MAPLAVLGIKILNGLIQQELDDRRESRCRGCKRFGDIQHICCNGRYCQSCSNAMVERTLQGPVLHCKCGVTRHVG